VGTPGAARVPCVLPATAENRVGTTASVSVDTGSCRPEPSPRRTGAGPARHRPHPTCRASAPTRPAPMPGTRGAGCATWSRGGSRRPSCVRWSRRHGHECARRASCGKPLADHRPDVRSSSVHGGAGDGGVDVERGEQGVEQVQRAIGARHAGGVEVGQHLLAPMRRGVGPLDDRRRRRPSRLRMRLRAPSATPARSTGLHPAPPRGSSTSTDHARTSFRPALRLAPGNGRCAPISRDDRAGTAARERAYS